MDNDEYKTALSAALRLLQHNDRTENEIRDRLVKKGVDTDVAEKVVAYLVENNYLNDERYAEYYVTCYSGRRSKRRIIMDLADKGIDDRLIARATDNCDDSEALYLALTKQLRKRNVTEGCVIGFQEQSKIAASLYRQGFDSRDIADCMVKEFNFLDITVKKG